MQTSFVGLKGLQNIKLIFHVMVLMTFPISVPALAHQQQTNSEEGVADRAKAEWLDGAPNRALEILDQEAQEDPPDLTILKLRGDIFATSRRRPEPPAL